MSQCFDEGIFQGFLDNELSAEMAESVAVHIAACSKCAEALSAASSETLVMSNAFEAEMALDVPTVRLRERIDAAIGATTTGRSLSDQRSRWNLRDSLAAFAATFGLSPQRALGFAGIIMLVAFAGFFVFMRSSNSPTEVASTAPTKKNEAAAVIPTPTPVPPRSSDDGPEPEAQPNQQRPKPKRKINPNDVPEPSQLPRDDLARALPGELNYLKAIDSLAVEIESGGDTALKPSLRAEYERNLAVVDQAIDSTRRVARRRPNDRDAASFLYSSYQSKLDLLTAVAEQVRPTIATR